MARRVSMVLFALGVACGGTDGSTLTRGGAGSTEGAGGGASGASTGGAPSGGAGSAVAAGGTTETGGAGGASEAGGSFGVDSGAGGLLAGTGGSLAAGGETGLPPGAWTLCAQDADCLDGRVCTDAAAGLLAPGLRGACVKPCITGFPQGCDPPPSGGSVLCMPVYGFAALCSLTCTSTQDCPADYECATGFCWHAP